MQRTTTETGSSYRTPATGDARGPESGEGQCVLNACSVYHASPCFAYYPGLPIAQDATDPRYGMTRGRVESIRVRLVHTKRTGQYMKSVCIYIDKYRVWP